jgi:Ser-tRNA(Ala) deacylase AlaX
MARYFHAPFDLPTTRFVGLLSCQSDPMLRRLDTTVLTCRKSELPAFKTNQAKKAAKSQEAPAAVYEITLQDTVLFPEGGGQPSDVGTIQHEQGVVKVSQVVRQGLTAVHYANAPLPVGAAVSVETDFDRRLDLMQQHTGQHVGPSLLLRKPSHARISFYRMCSKSTSKSPPSDGRCHQRRHLPTSSYRALPRSKKSSVSTRYAISSSETARQSR